MVLLLKGLTERVLVRSSRPKMVMKLNQGHVYIAPGGLQMEVVKYKYNLICKVYEGEKVNRHCPSVEVLFKSVAKVVSKKVISVMLTGYG